MKAFGVLVALVVLVVACAAPVGRSQDPRTDGCGRTFFISQDFPEWEREALNRAADRWNELAAEQFCTLVVSKQKAETAKHGIFRIQYGSAHWKSISDAHNGADVLGIHYGSTDQIGIVDVLGVELFEVVALHEFGHAHGLDHTPAPSIMHAAAGTASEFTMNDMAECYRVEACRKGD